MHKHVVSLTNLFDFTTILFHDHQSNRNVWNMRKISTSRIDPRQWTRGIKFAQAKQVSTTSLRRISQHFPLLLVRCNYYRPIRPKFPIAFFPVELAHPRYIPFLSPSKINFTPLRRWGVILKNRVYPENNLESAAAVGPFPRIRPRNLFHPFRRLDFVDCALGNGNSLLNAVHEITMGSIFIRALIRRDRARSTGSMELHKVTHRP